MRMIAGLTMLIALCAYNPFAAVSYADEASPDPDIHAGYYSREGNYGNPAQTTGHSIYIKFFADHRVVLLYVPFPYSKTVDPMLLHGVFESIDTQTNSGSYVRSRFDLLAEAAVAHVETYTTEGSRTMFECDANGPCVVEFSQDSLVMSKNGIIGKHIIKFDQIDEASQ